MTADTYEADLASYNKLAADIGGYVYESGTGHILWSAEAMTEAELTEHWDYIEANSAYFEALEYTDEWEDPDSDGYGWERRALARL